MLSDQGLDVEPTIAALVVVWIGVIVVVLLLIFA